MCAGGGTPDTAVDSEVSCCRAARGRGGSVRGGRVYLPQTS